MLRPLPYDVLPMVAGLIAVLPVVAGLYAVQVIDTDAFEVGHMQDVAHALPQSVSSALMMSIAPIKLRQCVLRP
jgi:hypothetical protein